MKNKLPIGIEQVWLYLSNLGVQETSTTIQRIRTRAMNIYCIFISLLLLAIYFSDLSRTDWIDTTLLSVFISLHILVFVLHRQHIYTLAMYVFNIFTPLRTTLTMIAYGLGANVLLFPITIIFGIVCYEQAKVRAQIIIWNLVCILLAIVMRYYFADYFTMKVSYFDKVTIIGIGISAITYFFILIVKLLEKNYVQSHLTIESITEQELVLINKNIELEKINASISAKINADLDELKRAQSSLKQELAQGGYEDALEYMELSNQSTHQMVSILEELAKYKVEDADSLAYKDVDLNALIAQLKTELSVHAKYGIGELLIKNTLPIVKGSTNEIKLLFQNLVTNGLKYNTSQVPQVTLSAEESEDFWFIKVSDNGIGIPQSEIKKLFVPFKRLSNAEGFEGTGLGMAIVKRILENHEWEVVVNSEVGKGSELTIQIKKSEA